MKFTPENITHLEPNQIFVYGANEKGIHGAGAARLALQWGAKMGQYGLVGQTYGIPTKDKKINTLPLDKIQVHVDTFLATAFSYSCYFTLPFRYSKSRCTEYHHYDCLDHYKQT